MPLPLDTSGSTATRVVLPVICATHSAEDLRVQLVVALDTGEPVAIDASQVEMVGQAVLQLLIAARSEAAGAGTEFCFENPSDAFVARATACRADSLIGLDRNKDDQP